MIKEAKNGLARDNLKVVIIRKLSLSFYSNTLTSEHLCVRRVDVQTDKKVYLWSRAEWRYDTVFTLAPALHTSPPFENREHYHFFFTIVRYSKQFTSQCYTINTLRHRLSSSHPPKNPFPTFLAKNLRSFL